MTEYKNCDGGINKSVLGGMDMQADQVVIYFDRLVYIHGHEK